MKRVKSDMLRRTCFAAALFFVLVLSAPGCGQGNKTTQTKVTKPQTIRITGSSTCLPLLKILSNKYEKQHPEVRFLYLPGAHSPAGIQGAANGTLDIGAISRDLKPEEQALGLETIILSNDGLAIATNKDLNIASLTTDQVKMIYGGEITNWRDVGGPDKTIVVLDRAEDESSKVILRKFVLGDTLITSSASILFLETDLIKALENTSYSIGYLSYGAVVSDKLPVNVLPLNGTKVSVKNIHNGTYKMVRPLGMVLKKNPSAATRAFVDWATSSAGAKVMDSKGYASAK